MQFLDGFPSACFEKELEMAMNAGKTPEELGYYCGCTSVVLTDALVKRNIWNEVVTFTFLQINS